MRCQELGEALLLVFVGGRLLTRKARAGAASEIAGDLDLARERKHVGVQPRVQQYRFVNLLRLRVRGALLDDAFEIGEHPDEQWHRGLIHRNRHRAFSWSGARLYQATRRQTHRGRPGSCQHACCAPDSGSAAFDINCRPEAIDRRVSRC
jgi:hypothetical protein